MLSALHQRRSSHRQSKNEQFHDISPELKSRGAVLLDVLKTLEGQLQSRGFLPDPAASGSNPVWFLAETERNVFLWRQGCSIIQQDEFEFWVDVRGLVEKRLRSLEHFDPSNPFMNPLWGEVAPHPGQADAERDYLESFLEHLESVSLHAHALCEVGSRALRELCPEAKEREKVLIPSPGKAARTPPSP